MLKPLFFSFLLLCLASPAVWSHSTEELAGKIEKEIVKASLSNQGVMDENVLLKINFQERGKRDAQQEVPLQIVTKEDPSVYLPQINQGYEHKKYYLYQATEAEKTLSDVVYEPQSNLYLLQKEAPIQGRPIFAYKTVFSGYQLSDLYNGTVGCKAYALAPQWLITSASCPIEAQDSSSVQLDGITYDMRTDRQIQSFYVGQEKIEAPSYFLNRHIALIYIPQHGNTTLISQLRTQKSLKLMGFKQPRNIFTLAALGYFYIHTSRYGDFVSDKKQASLAFGSLDGDTFRAKARFNATATDPFFFVFENQEYLTAFSAAKESYSLYGYFNSSVFNPWHGYSSDQYTILTEDDLQFIEQTVQQTDASAWQEIKFKLFSDSPNRLFE